MLKKSLMSVLLILTFVLSCISLNVFAEDGAVEKEIYVWYNDSASAAFIPFKVTDRVSVPGGVQAESSEVVYNGTNSVKVWDSQGSFKYNSWFDKLIDINADVKAAVESGNAYICGWFYTDTEKTRIRLVGDQLSMPVNEWVFLYEKVDDMNLTEGSWDTRGEGVIYIDDLRLVTVSDGSAPKPSERSVTIPSEPDRYTNNIYTYYSNGTLAAKPWHNTGNAIKNSADTEHVRDGHASSLKLTGELYLMPTLTEDVKAAISEGRAYLTFWQFIPEENIPEGSEDYVDGGKLDIYWNGKVSGSEGKWAWGKYQIPTNSEGQIYFKSKNKYLWLDDLCITVFEDVPEGFIEESYELQSDGQKIETQIAAGAGLQIIGKYFNNTRKLETLVPITAVYTADGVLKSVEKGETVSILPFNSIDLNCSLVIPGDSSGCTAKVMIWSELDEMIPVRKDVMLDIDGF